MKLYVLLSYGYIHTSIYDSEVLLKTIYQISTVFPILLKMMPYCNKYNISELLDENDIYMFIMKCPRLFFRLKDCIIRSLLNFKTFSL